MSQLKLTADSGGGTVAIKGPASTTGNAALEMTVPSTASDTLDSLKRSGNILQVVKTNVTATSSYGTSANSHYTLTPLNTTITPVGTNSHYIISAQVSGEGTVSNQQYFLRLVRNTTSGFADASNVAIAVGDNGSNNTAPENTSAFHGYHAENNDSTISTAHISSYVDSPSVSAGGNLQYKVQLYMQTGTTWYMNRTKTEYNQTYGEYLPSWITVMEVAA